MRHANCQLVSIIILEYVLTEVHPSERCTGEALIAQSRQREHGAIRGNRKGSETKKVLSTT